MSYILDALRKAEAERGGVPDVHASALLAAAPTPNSSAGALRRWRLQASVLAGVLAGALAVAGAAWLQWGRDALPSVAPAVSAAAPGASAAAQAVARAAAASAASAAVAVVPAASAADTPHRASAVAVAAPSEPTAKPAPRSEAAEARPRRPKAPAGPTKDDGPATAAATATTTAKRAGGPSRAAQAAAEPAPRLPQWAQLPAELRRQLPPLAVGGSVYSPQPRARMVIVDGQVFQEGSQLTPELTLEQIRPKAAVLSIRGTRFELPL
ncbi:MAG TPA: general secretion pathway protein GspB [Rubrivivax sp.]|nr:general secretion pathway protein GspB [Rubrivivax sp.]HPO17651.1 general secretion pathway protein GspB [Rubrivivax sp.]